MIHTGMNYFKIIALFGMVAPLSWVSLSAAVALSPAALQQRLAGDEPHALIDLRSGAAFNEAHLPGAMNMPLRGLNPRRLPSSRVLVFYADGLGRVDARTAAEQVSAQSGRSDVYWLRGGLAAWESAGQSSTRPDGFSTATVPAITYQNMVATEGRDLFVLDTRTEAPAEEPAPGTFGLASAPAGPQPTDLQVLLPQARVERPADAPTDAPGTFQLAGDAASESLDRQANGSLIVVVDDGDGSGAGLVRSLRAAGNRRVVLLAGGETILRHAGRPGLGRQSSGAYVIDGTEGTSTEDEQ